jgi:hypothetical protein
MFLLALFPALLLAEGPAGSQIGAEVPYFYVREVTGTHPNVATCLVCRYGRRPVVMLCVRELDEQVEQLLVAVDRAVDRRRGEGIKGFAFFMPAEPADTQAKLMTLARRQQMALPLTFPIEEGGPRTLQLPAEARVTVLCYVDHKIVGRLTLEAGKATAEKIEQIVAAVEQLAPRE